MAIKVPNPEIDRDYMVDGVSVVRSRNELKTQYHVNRLRLGEMFRACERTMCERQRKLEANLEGTDGT